MRAVPPFALSSPFACRASTAMRSRCGSRGFGRMRSPSPTNTRGACQSMRSSAPRESGPERLYDGVEIGAAVQCRHKRGQEAVGEGGPDLARRVGEGDFDSAKQRIALADGKRVEFEAERGP